MEVFVNLRDIIGLSILLIIILILTALNLVERHKNAKERKKFKISDRVYMNSPYGIYKGTVKDIDGDKMFIEYASPTAKSTISYWFEIKETEWRKY